MENEQEYICENFKKLDDLVEFLKEKDNSKNYTYFSKVPEICKQESCLLGVDEAGRGPVLGPMVYGVAYCPINKGSELEELKCADSKTLTEEKRNDLLMNICSNSDMMGWAVELNSPNVICNNMLDRKKITLNEVAFQSTVALIRKVLDAGVNLKEVYVDTLGPPDKHQKNLTEYFENKINFHVEKKADSLYPIVSAASICAKVVRDHALKTWKFREDIDATYEDFGSGYPNDPLTKKFLTENVDGVFGYPQLVRFSWSSSENVLKNAAVDVTWSDVEDEEKETKAAKKKKAEPVKKNMKITSFFTKFASAKDKTVQLPDFFTERSIYSVEHL